MSKQADTEQISKFRQWSYAATITPEERQILNAAMARGVRLDAKDEIPARYQRDRHTAHAEHWLVGIKRISALYRAVLEGKIALKFVGDKDMPHNPDDMRIYQVSE